MAGFDASIDSLRAAADSIDTITDESRAASMRLEAPPDLGHKGLENAAEYFTTGWNGAAVGMVGSSSALSEGLRRSALGYEAADLVGEAMLKLRAIFGGGDGS